MERSLKIPRGVVIRIKNKKLHAEVCRILDKYRYFRSNGRRWSWDDRWSEFRTTYCIDPYEGSAADDKVYKELGRDIMRAEEFIWLHESPDHKYMRANLKIPPKTAIRIYSAESDLGIRKLLSSLFYRWWTGERFEHVGYFDKCHEYCIIPDEGNYAPLDFLEEQGYNIISDEEFWFLHKKRYVPGDLKIKRGTVIHCGFSYESRAVSKILDRLGYRWSIYEGYLDSHRWRRHKSEFCINPHDGTCASVEDYKGLWYNIMPAQEFIRLHEFELVNN